MGHDEIEQDKPVWHSRFAVGKDDQEIVLAVRRAQALMHLAEYVQNVVIEQSVAALRSRGLSVRQIEQLTGIPKSKVGRVVKYQRGLEEGYAIAGPMSTTVEATERNLREVWGQ